MSLRPRFAAALSGLAVVLALVASGPLAASAFAAPGGGIRVEQAPKAHLLLFHGGSFLFEDPLFEPATQGPAEAAGFVTHYVEYPLGNVPEAILRARQEARRLRQRYGIDRVYAYGYSAGGTLAALLAGEGLVNGAVAKAPPTDLINWAWPQGRYGLDYYLQVGLDTEARYRLSPLRRPLKKPLLVFQGRADGVVPLAMNEQYAAKFDRAHLWVVAGGHTTERVRPFLIPRSMEWLHDIYDRKLEAEAKRERERERREEEAAKAKEEARNRL